LIYQELVSKILSKLFLLLILTLFFFIREGTKKSLPALQRRHYLPYLDLINYLKR